MNDIHWTHFTEKLYTMCGRKPASVKSNQWLRWRLFSHVLRMNKTPLLDRQWFCIFRVRTLRGCKGIAVQLHLLCHMITRKHSIWVLRPNLRMRQLLRWRKIGCSGSQLLRKLQADIFSDLRRKKIIKQRAAREAKDAFIAIKRVEFGAFWSVCLNGGSCLSQWWVMFRSQHCAACRASSYLIRCLIAKWSFALEVRTVMANYN
jgi:hypothetical protein